jgi:hypothetical protein
MEAHMVMQEQLHVQAVPMAYYFKQIKIYIILKPPEIWFFFILQHGKEHQIFGIRAIIELYKQALQ